jgi:hypothetical protein
MSDYTKTTNFTAKDSLLTGDPNKLIKGSLFDIEFDALSVAIATKEDSANKGAASGYCPLNASSEIDLTYIPTTLTGKNADMVDGYHVGNSSGQVPVSNGSLCVNLNADQLDGIESSGFIRINGGGNVTSGNISCDNNISADGVITGSTRISSPSYQWTGSGTCYQFTMGGQVSSTGTLVGGYPGTFSASKLATGQYRFTFGSGLASTLGISSGNDYSVTVSAYGTAFHGYIAMVDEKQSTYFDVDTTTSSGTLTDCAFTFVFTVIDWV